MKLTNLYEILKTMPDKLKYVDNPLGEIGGKVRPALQ
jgi:hypothetical protein